MRRLSFILAAIFIFSTGCAPVISQKYREQARADIPFSAVAANPSAYKGSLFIWGGTIVDTSPTRTGTTIEVVQTPIDRIGAPENLDASEGRFLVRINRFLDPQIYSQGRQVTVAGVLTGSEIKALGQAEYEYPVLDVREIYLWREEPDYYYPYYPPYYDYPYPGYWGPRWHRYYWCDPYWDPWCRYP